MMSRDKRTLLIVGGVILFWFGSLAAVAITVVRAGMLTVQVRQECPRGGNVDIRVPAALAIAALELVPADLLRDSMKDSPRWAPMARSLSKCLAKGPDCILVAVDSPREVVRIAKKGRHLTVDVRDDSERVHISVPLTLAAAMIGRIDRASRG